MTNLKDTKSVWKYLRTANKKTSACDYALPYELEINGQQYTNSQDIAFKLNSISEYINTNDVITSAPDLTIIPTFHWTTFPLRSWRSRSFSKIIPNRSRSVDSHTIWGLHVSSTFPLRFCYAAVTLLPRCSRFGCVVVALLLRSRYDNEDPATLRVR